MSDARPAPLPVHVVDVPERDRYEARLDDGTVAGFAVYQRVPGVVVVLHTEVEPAHEGRGVASALAAGALDLLRAAGETIVPLCPFFRAYLQRHPELDDLRARPEAARAATAALREGEG